MGYHFQQLKEQRDKQLREVCLRELRTPKADLFAPRPSTYVATYTCQVRSGVQDHLAAGTTGLLSRSGNEKVLFWANETVGYLCQEDAADLLTHFPESQDGEALCAAKITEEPGPFKTCKLTLLPIEVPPKTEEGNDLH
jgi:hypothetical protein